MEATISSTWQVATVVEVKDETARIRTFRLQLSEPVPHLPGQHYAVRLTAPDGYTATRSYSVASAPDASGRIDLTVERLDDGEVSTFLHDEVVVGDELEVRGPLGGWFVWQGERPALLLAGGSGVVPLMAMLRHARALDREGLLRLVVSVRSPDDLAFADEIVGPSTTVLFTRRTPEGWGRPAGRLSVDDLRSVVDDGPAGADAGDLDVFVCGSVGFTTHAVDLLVAELGVPADRIKVELFGPAA